MEISFVHNPDSTNELHAIVLKAITGLGANIDGKLTGGYVLNLPFTQVYLDGIMVDSVASFINGISEKYDHSSTR